MMNEEEDNKHQEEEGLDKALKAKKVVKLCRRCSGDHWTSKCPKKDTVLAEGKISDETKVPIVGGPSAAPETSKAGGSDCLTSNVRDGVAKPKDDTFAIRITNLSESTTESDLEDLIKPFGPIKKRYLAKDKKAGYCKGFAYVHFKFRKDAAKAIAMLNGHRYDELILTVDWSKPSLTYTYITSKEEDNKQEDEGLDKLKALGDKNVVKCRTCSGDHWTSKCPWKDTMLAGGKIPDDKKRPAVGGPSAAPETSKAGGSKYIPTSMRDGAAKRSDNPNMARRDDATAIRITNLSESTTESDLEDLVKPFGPIQKLYLAKDKQAGYCKGFAYVNFKFRNDAAKAIAKLNGHEDDHLILSVDWSKPCLNH